MGLVVKRNYHVAADTNDLICGRPWIANVHALTYRIFVWEELARHALTDDHCAVPLMLFVVPYSINLSECPAAKYRNTRRRKIVWACAAIQRQRELSRWQWMPVDKK